jgi:hypothetical protein
MAAVVSQILLLTLSVLAGIYLIYNAGRQARLKAGAERTLEAAACTSFRHGVATGRRTMAV